MHVVISFLLGAVVGAGLLYGFRGYLAHKKAQAEAEAAALKASAVNAVQDAAKKV